MIGPIWIFKGRQYKTVIGLLKALSTDSGAEWIAAVDKDRIIKAGNGRNADQVITARYSVTKPEIGKPMYVERVQS